MKSRKAATEPANSDNRLLARLPQQEFDRLAPHLDPVDLAFKQILYEPGRRIEYVYFVESGIISVVTDLEEGGVIETGTIGREGFVGVPIILGMDSAPQRVLCQIPGRAVCMTAKVALTERRRGGPLAELFLRTTHAILAMAAQSAACNRGHSIEQRLSRWLLMTHDRVDSDQFPLTQEFLAQMLGVHLPSVNIAGIALQKAGLIQYSRGKITIVDRAGLQSASCECYGIITREFERALR